MEARLKAEEIVENDNLPQVITSTGGRAIEIGIADYSVKDASGRVSGSKRVIRNRTC